MSIVSRTIILYYCAVTDSSAVVCYRYDRLRADIVTMLNLQRHVQKKEQEVHSYIISAMHVPA